MTAQRLFAAGGPGLDAHRRRFGTVPESSAANLAALLDAAGLTGRGGAGFPTGRKLASVTGRRAVVVGNGAEGEPLSSKDAELLSRAPHLVLDGLEVAAAAVAATTVVVYVPARVTPTVRAALAERRSAGLQRHRVRIVEAPDRFVAGEESAVVRRVEGGPALPRDRTVLTSVSGVRGRPTLVDNVETLAHVALIARYGPSWFRSVGDPAEPGTMLVTLTGAADTRTVREVPTGTPLAELVGPDAHAVLVGGYHGAWIPGRAVATARLSRAGLAPLGATPGAGIVHVLPGERCGLARTADILDYLAGESAGQCGPCLFGLPRLAGLFTELAHGLVGDRLLTELHRTVDLVDGRGACRHPDGTARLARSALTVFSRDIAQHRHGGCTAAQRTLGRNGFGLVPELR